MKGLTNNASAANSQNKIPLLIEHIDRDINDVSQVREEEYEQSPVGAQPDRDHAADRYRNRLLDTEFFGMQANFSGK